MTYATFRYDTVKVENGLHFDMMFDWDQDWTKDFSRHCPFKYEMRKRLD